MALKITDSSFPKPPLRGSSDIVPLRNREALKSEAKEQGIPLLHLIPDIMTERAYVYRINAPERATLHLRKLRDARWRIGKVKSKEGRPVAVPTMQFVESLVYHRPLDRPLEWVGSDQVVRG